MFIDIHELEVHRIEFRDDFPPQKIDLGPDVRALAPVHAVGRAELVEEHHGARKKIQDIRVVGDFATRVELSCARCLEPVIRDLAKTFDLLYRPQGVDAGHEELTVTDAEAEIGYYTGNGLLLEDVLREQVLLAVPLKAICREECRGICPQCGKNRNLEPCSCPPPADARWEALKGLGDKLKQ